ncbi:unnamed protein product [Zymoseptoria tritici ST99CH_1A5]|uniref:Uncharacterized protein n=1 Tax=Zymoseptoria tritici ST99CH_1A5 TaxID=1276529 RepID=A0A1Y6LWR3_ZYMTR|nr:unnamed protein product [Zymoseptoria tritici ST99CH_1A5]
MRLRSHPDPLADGIYDRCHAAELKVFCSARGIAAPMDSTRQAHYERRRLLIAADLQPQFHGFVHLPVELRLRILDIVVGSQNRRDTEKLLLTNHATSHEAKQIQHEIIPFKIHLRVDHRESINTASTIMTVGRSGTDLSFYSWINYMIAAHASLLDDKYHSALSFEQHFPAQLNKCRHIKLQFAIGCRLDPDALWPLQYLHPGITLSIVGELPPGFDSADFNEKRAASEGKQDSIALYNKLRPSYDLAIGLLEPSGNLAQLSLAITLKNAMLTVRQVGSNGNFASTSTSDEAACTALHKLEEEMLDVPMKSLLAAKATLEAKKAEEENEEEGVL